MDRDALLALALFDEETTARMHRWKTVICREQDSCDLLPAHLTLGQFEAGHEKALAEAAARFAAETEGVSVAFSHVGVFGTSVCFAAPCVDEALLSFHEKFHTATAALHSEVGRWYAPGLWAPHSTLYLGPWPGMQAALAAALHNFVPFEGRITAVGVGRTMHPLQIFPLRPGETAP